MPTDSELALYVLEQLEFLGQVSNRAIFGGIGIFCKERLLGIVVEEMLYLHTGAGNIAEYESRGMPRFRPYPNAFDLSTAHHQVPPEIIQDPAQLKSWARHSLRAAIESAQARQLAGIERVRHRKRTRKKRRPRD